MDIAHLRTWLSDYDYTQSDPISSKSDDSFLSYWVYRHCDTHTHARTDTQTDRQTDRQAVESLKDDSWRKIENVENQMKIGPLLRALG